MNWLLRCVRLIHGRPERTSQTGATLDEAQPSRGDEPMMEGKTPLRTVACGLCPAALAGLALVGFAEARAAAIDVGNPDVSLRWDNTVKVSAAVRLKSADPALLI